MSPVILETHDLKLILKVVIHNKKIDLLVVIFDPEAIGDFGLSARNIAKCLF